MAVDDWILCCCCGLDDMVICLRSPRGNKVYEPPRFMTVNEAVEQLLYLEEKRGEGGLSCFTHTYICIYIYV